MKRYRAVKDQFWCGDKWTTIYHVSVRDKFLFVPFWNELMYGFDSLEEINLYLEGLKTPFTVEDEKGIALIFSPLCGQNL